MDLPAIEKQSEDRINSIFWDGATTRMVKLGSGALSSVPECLDALFPGQSVVVVADQNTYAAAGREVCEILRAAGREVLDPFVFEEDELHADYGQVEILQQFLAGNQAVPVAVGSGTINDLAKLASHQCDRPYMVVGTAASMDGYTAYGAAITKGGYKQTISCPAPVAVVVDLNVIADAPSNMNAAGYADLIAKVPAGADWLVAEALGVEPIHTEAFGFVQTHLREWVSNPSGVRSGEASALLGLAEGLIMTGVGMQRAQSSRPASGADHQFSHLWDMQGHTFEGTTPMHGCKVAIGSIASTVMYEQVLAMDAGELKTDEASIRAYWPEWKEVEQAIRDTFPDASLAGQVVKQSRDKYLDAGELAKRLQCLEENWDGICGQIKKQIIPAAELRQMLADSGAPHEPEEIGIDRERLHASHAQARMIRSRYTVLDLVAEAGWWTPCVVDSFKEGGFWA